MSAAAEGWDQHLEELYAAACIYLSDPARGERLLRQLLSTFRPSTATDRPELHRVVYRAAVDAGARSAPPRADGCRLERAMSLLPLRTRASLFLVDSCGLRYAEVARVIGVTAERIDATVATGRSRLRTTLDPRSSSAPAHVIQPAVGNRGPSQSSR